MTTEQELLVQEYAKNPLCNYKMEEYTITSHEGNFICGDDINIYLVLEDNVIKKYSFDGDCSNITTAAASFLSEFITGQKIEDVLNWNFKLFIDKGFDVSKKRRRAMVIGLMAVRNAIHNYLNDGKKDNFDDLLEE
ncbi:MAG: iron-sulfur cluster assembly scaffold protein [Candidatus Absconditicoccaceae bacterium]